MDSRGYLFDLVRRLDEEMGADVGAAHVTFVRALVAGGALLASMPTIERTMRAARAFLERPCDETYGALQIAATDSYPYGPGDGCLSVPETGVEGCARGSGCTSGSGTLVEIAHAAGWDATAAAIRATLRAED